MSPLYRGFHQNDEGTEEIFMKNKRIQGNWIFGYLVPLHDNVFAIIDEPIERWGTGCTPVEKIIINETICEWTRLYDNTKWENITEAEQQAFLLTKKDNENIETIDYVLSNFTKEQLDKIHKLSDDVLEIISHIIKGNIHTEVTL